MTLPPGWIEVHGWSMLEGYRADKPPQRLLLQVKYIQAVTPEDYDGPLLTNLWFGQYAHKVEKSVVHVQELMVAALAGNE